MKHLSIYRRRFIPNELVHLKKDLIISRTDKLIITKWDVLYPRNDIAGGISAYYLDLGIKVSKVFDKDHKLVYWYCDIFQAKLGSEPDSMIFEDLLVDVLVYQDGSVKILDLDELAEAYELQLITDQEVTKALRILDSLLRIIYKGEFHTLMQPLEEI